MPPLKESSQQRQSLGPAGQTDGVAIADTILGELGAGATPEKVVFRTDQETGLKAVVSLHSTALGPALGGTRFHAYGCAADAVLDSLNLARDMSYKNAVAGLSYGGGKAVIIGDPAVRKTPRLLRAYGRFVESLSGAYVTSCDVGTASADMDIIGEETRHVVGRSRVRGGVGDPSELTAYGVLQGMHACAEVRWGSPGLRGRRVGVCGLGKVGHHLVGLLIQAGASVVASDIRPGAIARTLEAYPTIATAAAPQRLLNAELDIYAPCALGGALDPVAVNTLQAAVVCGAANNQLGYPGAEQRLLERNITYAPDYVVNSGGLIHVAEENSGVSAGQAAERAHEKATAIYDTTVSILTTAADTATSPCAVADELAEQRMTRRPLWPSPPSATERLRFMKKVRQATHDLLRHHDMRVIFGNPGSTELPFLGHLPADFTYILGSTK